MMESVGFGIIGTDGLWSELHARIYSTTEGISLAGVADLAEHKAESFAQSYGTMHYTDWRTLLADDLIKAISILTPIPTHGEVALAAVEAGKHVLVEPPLATNADECAQIIEAAETSDVKVMVGFHNRWVPPLCQSRESLTEIGDVEFVSFQASHRIDIPTEKLDWAGETTVAWFSGIHSVDTLRWLLSDEVHRVYAVNRTHLLKSMEVDTADYFQATIEFDSGATAYVEDSWVFPRAAENVLELRVKIAGSRGVLYANTGYTEDIFEQRDGFGARSIEHFIDCVLHDRAPSVTGDDGLRATRIIHAIELSAGTGVPMGVE